MPAALLSPGPVRFSTVQLEPPGPAVSLVWQEEEASLAAAAELLPFLTGARLQPGGHFQRTNVLPPGSAHEGQHGQGSGLLSGSRLPPQIALNQKGGNELLIKHLLYYDLCHWACLSF